MNILDVEFTRFAQEINRLAHDKGFWDGPHSFAEKIALVHSELSEALEADRESDPQSVKIPLFSSREEELADAVIRIMDLAQENHLDLIGAMIAKHSYNLRRPYKHGKEY